MESNQLKNLKTIMDVIPDIVIVKDANGRWMEATKRAVGVYGLDERYSGKSDTELGEIYPHLADHFSFYPAFDHKAWEAGAPIVHEENILVDGEFHTMEVKQIPKYDSYGRPESLVVICRDITERIKSQQRYRSLFSSNPEAVFSLDEHGVFLNINNEGERISGFNKEELLGKDFYPLIHPDDMDRVVSSFNKVKQGRTVRLEFKINHKNGEIRNINLTTIPAILYGEVIGIDGIAVDVTEKRRNEALQEMQTRILSRIAAGDSLDIVLPELIKSVENLTRDGICSILFYEKEHNHLRFGYGSKLEIDYREKIDKFPVAPFAGSCGHSAYTKELTIVPDIRTHPNWADWKEEALRYGLRSCWSIPILSMDRSLLGTFAVYYSRCRTPDHFEVEMLRVISYITGLAIERFHQEKEVQFLANHDVLTGLPNLRYLKQVFEDAIKETKTLAVMFLDLDGFKSINDSFGHSMGDTFLKEISQRITSAIGEHVVARMGGDEFIFLVKDYCDKNAVLDLAKNLLDAISQPVLILNSEFNVTGSIGISLYPEHGCTLDELMKKADIAMYSSKGLGGNSVQIIENPMNEKAYTQFSMQSDFKKAIKRKEFLLHYQPKINIQSGDVTGVEALVRWQHPERGLIHPGEFMQLAEESGFISVLGAWVLREALSQMKDWRERGYQLHLRMAVNVSVRQFIQQDIVLLVEELLKEMDLPPHCLELEITESVLMRHEHLIQDSVEKLREIGVEVSIDDFGTGYASFTYLKKFNANTIKIDRSFIHSLPHSQDDVAIVSAVIALAKELNMRVIAEGVETQDQLEFLVRKGCNEVQGFYFSPPLPLLELEGYLNNRKDLRTR